MSRKSVLDGNQRRSVAALAKKFGASRTAEILRAPSGSEDADLRPAILSDPVSLTVPTVCRYAKDNGVTLVRGRRKKV
jgi:hypothetical protein